MIPATELGKRTFDWWPDWRNECAAIVGSGPSIKNLDLSCLRDRLHIIAIKQSLEKCPWAEIVYGCDAAWWLHKKGLPEFKGIKLAHGLNATSQYKEIHRVEIKMVDELLLEKPLLIGNGGNSGFQALNLLIQFGVKDIILIGFDLHDHGGLHWYGRNTAPGMNNPAKSNFDRWKKGFFAIKNSIKALDIDVVNTSLTSELKEFRKQSLGDTLKEWGL
jgi:hypothetical protein